MTATGRRGLDIRRGGLIVASDRRSASSDGDVHSNVSAVTRLVGGDVVSVDAFQTSGAPLSLVGAGDSRNFLSIAWTGP